MNRVNPLTPALSPGAGRGSVALAVLLCALLMSAATVQAQPHIASITGPVDIGGRDYVIVGADNLPNKSVTIEAAPAHNFQDYWLGACYACNENEKTVVFASFPTDLFIDSTFTVFVFNPPELYFRGRNEPCNDFAPAAVGFAEPMTADELAVRVVHGGKVYRLQRLPDPFTPDFTPARRYVGIPE